jgi:hypothetical protein
MMPYTRPRAPSSHVHFPAGGDHRDCFMSITLSGCGQRFSFELLAPERTPLIDVASKPAPALLARVYVGAVSVLYFGAMISYLIPLRRTRRTNESLCRHAATAIS